MLKSRKTRKTTANIKKTVAKDRPQKTQKKTPRKQASEE